MSIDIYRNINKRGAYTIKIIVLAIIIILVIYYYNEREDPGEKYEKLKHEHHSNKKRQKDDKHSDKDEASIKGEQGEQEVIRLLSKLKLHGHILNNVYIPTKSGTTELDIIYVNQYGIYVVESKNYAGFIMGDDKYNSWVVQYRKGQGDKQNRFNFYSPVRQNETHIKHLRNTLPTIDKDDFKSIIVFVDPWKMKINSKYDVIPSKELNRLMINKAEKENKIFSKREVNKIYDILKTYSEVSEEVKLAHIEQVKKAKIRKPRGK